MTTIINNPPRTSGGKNGTVIVLSLCMVVGILLYLYGLPLLGRENDNTKTDIVPEAINVDVTSSQRN